MSHNYVTQDHYTWGIVPPYVGLLTIFVFCTGLFILFGLYFAKIERERAHRKQKEALEKYDELMNMYDNPLSKTERIIYKQQLEYWWNRMSENDKNSFSKVHPKIWT